MPKLKQGIILPTEEEDAIITAAAMADPDAIPFTDEEWEAAKPFIRMGRPLAISPKQAITVRYDADVIAAFKAGGKGWQTRMNAALKDWLKDHSPA
jgi:uncharacterized protein (DUF4415 family)